MRVFLLLCLLAGTVFRLAGQVEQKTLYQLLHERAPDCELVTYNAYKNIPRYYQQEKQDSMKKVLDYWDEHCNGRSGKKHLLLLKNIADPSIDLDFFQLEGILREYYNSRQSSGLFYGYPYRNEAHYKAEQEFYTFLEVYATELLAKREYSSLETDVLRFYAGDYQSLAENAREGKYSGSVFQEAYGEHISRLRYQDEIFFGIYGGAWVPTGNLSRVGGHPEFGVQAGAYHKRIHYAVVLGGRFMNAPGRYSVREYDSVYTTDSYSGLYAGLEIGWSLYRGILHDVEIGGGMAYDMLTAVPASQETSEGGVSVGALSLNAGIGYRYYYNYKNFIKIEGRYHFLNYSNGIDDGFQGNAITLRLIWGFTNNDSRRYQSKPWIQKN